MTGDAADHADDDGTETTDVTHGTDDGAETTDVTHGTDDGAETTDVTHGDGVDDILQELFAVIEDRKETLPEDSYTASLFTHEKGENAVLEKLGEEMTELVLAAKDDDTDELAHESADIVYHLLVLLAMKDMELADLQAELAARR